jgi:uncharacterized protein (TIGR02466 family)
MQKSDTGLEMDPQNPIADLMRNGQVENIFPTPIFYHVIKDCEELNDGLRTLILDRERIIPSASKSNIGGWQSQPDFFSWDAPEAVALLRYVRSALDIATIRVTAPQCVRAQFDVFGWAAVNRNGHYNTVHLHPGSTWSGVYYVDPGDGGADAAPSGQLEFVNPVPAAGMTFFPNALTSARLVEPKAGLIILFPSYLLHSARVYRGERPRICVPFNAHARMP